MNGGDFMVPEGHIAATYRFSKGTVKIADDELTKLAPGQIESNREQARAVAWEILRKAAEEEKI